MLAATLPPVYLALNIYTSKLRMMGRRVKDLDASLTGHFSEVVSGIRTVRGLGQEAAEADRIREMSRKVKNAATKLAWHVGIFQGNF